MGSAFSASSSDSFEFQILDQITRDTGITLSFHIDDTAEIIPLRRFPIILYDASPCRGNQLCIIVLFRSFCAVSCSVPSVNPRVVTCPAIYIIRCYYGRPRCAIPPIVTMSENSLHPNFAEQD